MREGKLPQHVCVLSLRSGLSPKSFVIAHNISINAASPDMALPVCACVCAAAAGCSVGAASAAYATRFN